MKILPLFASLLLLVACNSAKKAERAYGDALFQHWIHSFEDDTDSYKAYRPAAYAFPPARGREGFELKKDGSFTFYAIAPTDGSQAITGAWTLKGKHTLDIKLNNGSAMTIQLLEVSKDMLKARK